MARRNRAIKIDRCDKALDSWGNRMNHKTIKMVSFSFYARIVNVDGYDIGWRVQKGQIGTF